MKFEIDKGLLVPMLRRAAACTQERSTNEAFSQIRLTVADGKVEVVATDGYLQAQANAPHVVGKKVVDGVVYANAKGLLQKTEAMPDGILSFELTPSKRLAVKHKSASRSFLLPTATGESYPVVQWGDNAPEVLRMTGATFASIIAAVAWCAANGESDPAYNSVRFLIAGKRLIVDSTSRISGARLEMTMDQPDHDEIPLLTRAALEFADLAKSEGEKEILLLATDRTFYLEAESTRLGAAIPAVPPSQLGGIFDHLARTEGQETVVDRPAFSDAVRAVSLASTGGVSAVAIVWLPGAVHVRAEGDGEGSDVLPTASPVKHAGWRAVNTALLLAAAKAMQGASISITTTRGASDPIVVAETRPWCSLTVFLAPLRPERNDVLDALVKGGGA